MTKKEMEQEVKLLRKDLDTVINYLSKHEDDYILSKSIIHQLNMERLSCCEPGILGD